MYIFFVLLVIIDQWKMHFTAKKMRCQKCLDTKTDIQKMMVLWEQAYRDRWWYNKTARQKVGPHNFDTMYVTVIVHISKVILGCG